MVTAVLTPDLQSSVDRFARSLAVPSRLQALHPRKKGGSGNAAALAPAITQCAISAFEGFAEDFLRLYYIDRARALLRSYGKMNLTNPDVSDFEDLAIREFPDLASQVGIDFNVDIWAPPPVGKSWRTPYRRSGLGHAPPVQGQSFGS